MLSRGKIKKINSLKDKKTRQISQLFTIEGIKSVKEISLSAFITIEELYAVPEFHALASSIAPGRTEEISPEDMRRISSQTTPEGLLAVCRIPNHGHFAFKEGQLVIALDDIRDPGNLGTIVRLADWFGVEDILCSKSTVDLYNPKTVQSTMGSIARVRVHYTDLAETLARCPLRLGHIPCESETRRSHRDRQRSQRHKPGCRSRRFRKNNHTAFRTHTWGREPQRRHRRVGHNFTVHIKYARTEWQIKKTD